ncbi:preprotein translocase subunit SecY [Candidatus Woesearchaeota archaeon]|nr:preprotein translocase subunit SecY [Candidatus Woesearchaeota archaeon]
MSLMDTILMNLPEVKAPLQKKLAFKDKLKWTLIILVAFFLLGLIPLYGLGENSLSQFEFLSIILGASFGSIISLGIGPLVTGSIVLQLLNGSGLVKFDLTTHEGKKKFQGIQKILSLFFILFEAGIYVFMGGLSPSLALDPTQFRTMQLILILQLVIGGILIMFMDEIISKWGFGSGISLFIAAGVASEVVIRAFSPLTTAGAWAFGSSQAPVGKVWVLIESLASQNPTGAALAFAAIIATLLIFFLAVYLQSMKVEIPLSFGRIRGHGIRWPLQFLYTSNIPVILIAALLANVQLWARLLEKWGHPLLGLYSGSTPISGFVLWVTPQNIVQNIITGNVTAVSFGYAAVYMAFMIIGSIVFGIFWVQTSGMDASSQAKQMLASGLQIPGFRRDQRVLEAILSRYIFPLTVMGGATVGFLAAGADLMGALTRGTGLLLAVMIVYKLYEEIANQHMMDMHPALAKMMGKQ